MVEGETITLIGVTQKGKNRIREHGSKWIVHVDPFGILFESVQTGYLKRDGIDFLVDRP